MSYFSWFNHKCCENFIEAKAAGDIRLNEKRWEQRSDPYSAFFKTITYCPFCGVRIGDKRT